MPWFYVDDGFSNSKPVMDMPARHRLAACGLWVLAGSWAAKEETDGFVPDSVLKQLGARPSLVDTLTGFGPMSAPLWDEVETGVQFKSWAKWQRTRAELNEKRQADAERQRESRARKRKGRNAVTSDDSEVSRCDTSVTPESDEEVSRCDSHVTLTRACADPTRPDPLLVTSSGGVTSVDARETARPQCLTHPTENARTRCPDCQRRRKWDEAETARAQAAVDDAKRARRAVIDACALCDDFGRLDDLGLCDHQGAAHA